MVRIIGFCALEIRRVGFYQHIFEFFLFKPKPPRTAFAYVDLSNNVINYATQMSLRSEDTSTVIFDDAYELIE